jgi:hypothetical protein
MTLSKINNLRVLATGNMIKSNKVTINASQSELPKITIEKPIMIDRLLPRESGLAMPRNDGGASLGFFTT